MASWNFGKNDLAVLLESAQDLDHIFDAHARIQARTISGLAASVLSATNVFEARSGWGRRRVEELQQPQVFGTALFRVRNHLEQVALTVQRHNPAQLPQDGVVGNLTKDPGNNHQVRRGRDVAEAGNLDPRADGHAANDFVFDVVLVIAVFHGAEEQVTKASSCRCWQSLCENPCSTCGWVASMHQRQRRRRRRSEGAKRREGARTSSEFSHSK